MVQGTAPQLSVELELGRSSLAGGHWQWSAFKYSRRILVTAILDTILAAVLTGLLVFDLAHTIPPIHDTNVRPLKIWFILGITVELALIAGSVVGSVSVLNQRRSLLRRYAYFNFVHIFANLVALGVLWIEIGTFNSVVNCFADGAGCGGSDGPIKFALVYFVVGAVLLGIELYSAVILLSYLREVKVQVDDATLAASDKANHDHDEGEGGPEPLQAGDAHTNSNSDADSDSVSSLARPRELEENNQIRSSFPAGTQNMTREQLVMALVRAREELASARQDDRRSPRGSVTSSVGNVDRSPTQGRSVIRRFFSTLSTGTSRSGGSTGTAPPAYSDIV